MLKNPANAAFYTSAWNAVNTVCAMNVIGKAKKEDILLAERIERFIEQCPLKIKRIKIEGFV